MEDSLRLVIDVETRIGVPASERSAEQLLRISLEVPIDASAVSIADDPAVGIDYAKVSTDLHLLAKTERKTIERFAEDIASLLLRSYPVQKVRVTVSKSPPLEGVLEATISIERQKE